MSWAETGNTMAELYVSRCWYRVHDKMENEEEMRTTGSYKVKKRSYKVKKK